MQIKLALLPISLLPVMMGAAVAPVLADVNETFVEAGPQLIKMVMTLPALMIVPFSFLTWALAKKYRKKMLVMIGLLAYTIGGVGGALSHDIYVLLLFRALLGASIGVLSPLATGLIADYYYGAERTQMMGYASSANNLGGGLATIVAGFLAVFHWRYAFWIYGVALVVFLLVLFFLPAEGEKEPSNEADSYPAESWTTGRGVLKWASFTFLVIVIFFSIPTHLDLFLFSEELGGSEITGLLMGLLTGVSFVTGLVFRKLAALFREKTVVAAFALFLLSFAFLSLFSNLILLSLAVGCAGAAMGLLIPLIMDSVTKEVKTKDTILALAGINLFLYLGQFVSPLIPGAFESIFGLNSIRLPFYVSAFLTLASIVAFKVMKNIEFAPVSLVEDEDAGRAGPRSCWL